MPDPPLFVRTMPACATTPGCERLVSLVACFRARCSIRSASNSNHLLASCTKPNQPHLLLPTFFHVHFCALLHGLVNRRAKIALALSVPQHVKCQYEFEFA